MPAPTLMSSGYSPPIEMTLHVGDQKLFVAEIGPGYIVVKSARSFPPVEAELVVQVDDESVVRKIFLPTGIIPERDRQPMTVLWTGVRRPAHAAG